MSEGNVDIKELIRWKEMADELRILRKAEMELRRTLFAHAFPNPTEGTNTLPLSRGWVLKGQYGLDRNIDEAALTTMLDDLREQEIPEDIVQRKPLLVKKVYNKLTDVQRQVFDQCLIIKPSSPSMEIVLPAKNKPAAGDKAQ